MAKVKQEVNIKFAVSKVTNIFITYRLSTYRPIYTTRLMGWKQTRITLKSTVQIKSARVL